MLQSVVARSGLIPRATGVPTGQASRVTSTLGLVTRVGGREGSRGSLQLGNAERAILLSLVFPVMGV